MKEIIILALVLSIFTLGLPFNTLAAGEQNPNSIGVTLDEPPPPPASGGIKAYSGVIAAAVSVLGFIALAASVDSGDATPSTTPTTTH